MPRALTNLVDDDGRHAQPVFSFALVDRAFAGTWGWHLLNGDDATALINFMCEMARLSWPEIRRQRAGQHLRHHSQPIVSLHHDAQRQIENLEYDDIAPEMFRFRLDGTARLWGYEVGGVFHVVWWDPNHKVYETEPD
jgi:hypothetical protein